MCSVPINDCNCATIYQFLGSTTFSVRHPRQRHNHLIGTTLFYTMQLKVWSILWMVMGLSSTVLMMRVSILHFYRPLNVTKTELKKVLTPNYRHHSSKSYHTLSGIPSEAKEGACESETKVLLLSFPASLLHFTDFFNLGIPCWYITSDICSIVSKIRHAPHELTHKFRIVWTG